MLLMIVCAKSVVFLLRVTCANLGGMETLSGPRLLYGYLQTSWVAWAGQLFFGGDWPCDWLISHIALKALGTPELKMGCLNIYQFIWYDYPWLPPINSNCSGILGHCVSTTNQTWRSTVVSAAGIQSTRCAMFLFATGWLIDSSTNLNINR